MKKGYCAVVLLICVFSVLSGCSMLDLFTADTLLKAPKLTGENAELQKAFDISVGMDVTLLSPLTGNYRSAYILKDCDGDGRDEAFVFYVLSDSENNVHIHLLEAFSSGWKAVADITGNGSEVYKVDFCNIDGSDDYELAVTWTVSDTKKDKTLSLYKLDMNAIDGGNIINPLATVQIFDYYVIDLDSDGQNELFYIYLDSSEEKSGAYAKLLKAAEREDVLYPLSELKLDMRISGLLAVKCDAIDDRYEFFVDCAVGEGLYFTEIIQFTAESSALTLPVREITDDAVAYTRRSSLMYTADVNDDGLMEIPVETVSGDSYVINSSDGDNVPIRYINYQRFSERLLLTVSKYYVNNNFNYKVRLDQIEKFSYIVSDTDTGNVQFRLKNDSREDNVLFYIKADPSDNGSVGKKNIEVKVTPLGRSMDITRDFVESLID